MVHAIRILFLICLLALTVSFTIQEEMFRFGTGFVTIVILVPPLAGLAMVLIDTFWQRKRLHLVSAVFFGVLGGLLLAFILSLIVDLAVSLYPAPPPATRPTEPSPAATDPPELLRLYPITQQPGESDEEFAARKQAHLTEMRIKSARDHRDQFQAYQRQKAAYDDYVAHVRTVQLIKLVLGASAVFLCVTVVLQTKDDFRFVIPYVEFARQSKGPHPLILDTSVIIDGRIADVAETRVFESPMIVPRFVLAELQSIADSPDKLKRNRGRRGLDVLNRLQSHDSAEIQILDPHTPEVDQAPDVDSKLVALARQMDGRVVTNDYNLNKIARLRDVDVINLNDLSNALKPVVLPGEQMQVRVIKPGEEPGQGVGYLDDGTMVVIEQGREQIGNEVALVVTSVLQTSAGRMIFGRIDADTPPARKGRQTQAT